MKTHTASILLSFLLTFLVYVVYSNRAFETTHPESSFPPELVVIGDASGFPEGCDPITMTHIVWNFFDAYNNGEEERFAEAFPPNFTWYTDGQPEKGWYFLTTSRQELLPYFAGRHRQHERLSLIALHLLRSENDRPDLVHMSFSLHRQADDLEPGPDGGPRLGGGKGAMLCSQKKIYVWSMYIAPPDETTPMWSSICARGSHDYLPEKGVASVTACVGDQFP